MEERSNARKVPAIRFRGFEGEWEQRKVEDLGNIVTGATPPSNDQANYGGEHLFVSPADIQTNRYVENTITTLTDKGFRMSRILKEGSILFVSIGSTIGKVGQTKGLSTTNQQINSIEVNNILDKDFVFSLMEYKANTIKGLAATQAVPIVNKTSFSDVDVCIPDSVREQFQIGDFFKNLDNLITLQQQKYNKLKTIKKAMLEKMFPKEGADVPEIRFAGFTGAWSMRTIGEILSIKYCPIQMKDELDYQLVTVKRRNEGVISRGRLKGKNILVKNYFVIEEGDFLISKRQVVHGANGLVPKQLDKSIVSNEYLVITGNQDITSEFWALISKTRDSYQRFFLSSYGVDIEKLVFDVEDWKKRSITIPTLAEQERICNFFEDLDQHITLQHQKLEKLKNLKSALLEKMFV